MTEEAIVGNLRRALAEPLNRNKDVVYILVEIRKLMEQRELEDRFPALKFHCDWTLHARLSFSGARRILEQFDDVYKAKLDKGEANPRGPLEAIGRTITLAEFRKELRELLQALGLSMDLTDDDVKWVRFLQLYSEVIQDTPLIVEIERPKKSKRKPAQSFKYVRRVVLSNVTPLTKTPFGVYIFNCVWTGEPLDSRIEPLRYPFEWGYPVNE